MISLQSMMAYNLDEQGILPEKFADLALHPKFYEWYQKYYATSRSIYLFERVRETPSQSTTNLNQLQTKSSELVFQTAVEFSVEDESEYAKIEVETHDSSNYAGNGSTFYMTLYPTRYEAYETNAGMGAQKSTRTFSAPISKAWIQYRMHTKYGSKQSLRHIDLYWSTDGLSYSKIRDDDYTYYWNIRNISVYSKNYISLADTKFWADGVLLFEGSKAQRIEIS